MAPGSIRLSAGKSSAPRVLHAATVMGVIDLSPSMGRVTVRGKGLCALLVTMPAHWMKVFVPIGESGPEQGRAYTTRRHDAAAGEMVLDFALHGDTGPAAARVMRARLGDRVRLGGPRAGYQIDDDTPAYVLIGDLAALPAIAAIIERLCDVCHDAVCPCRMLRTQVFEVIELLLKIRNMMVVPEHVPWNPLTRQSGGCQSAPTV